MERRGARKHLGSSPGGIAALPWRFLRCDRAIRCLECLATHPLQVDFPMKIVQYPHPALRAKCRPLTALDESVRRTAAEMVDLMHAADGLGLAAPQVALDYQLVVMSIPTGEETPPLEVIAVNPVIVEGSGAFKDREGCLSFPGLYQDIRRFHKVKAQYYGLDGTLHEMICTDLAARLWQHEIDHLQGTLFIDKMTTEALRRSRRYLESYIDEFEEDLRKGKLPPGTAPKM